MGVYIIGLEIPPKGNGVVVILCSSGAVYLGGQKVGTATPVPPHGRLIDADAMIHDIEKSIAPSWYIKERNADMVKFLSLEDTIIPAEEAGQYARDGP